MFGAVDMDAFVNIDLQGSSRPLHFENSQQSSGLLWALLNELAHGVMVATLEGHVTHANEAARTDLLRSGLLESSGNLMRNCTIENSKAMNAGLAQVALGKRSLVTLSTLESAMTLTVALVPLQGSAGASRQVGLFFARTTLHESKILPLFAKNHGLTATEERVLGILSQGFSTPEIASQMKVAVSTIRTHVRSLCAKTRSCGVRELVNRVAVLPPVARTGRTDRVH
jgi:DNA-binding CsgD family transcriptional regulator